MAYTFDGRDEILKAARAVTEATQSLVQSAKGPQGELAKAVSTALETLTSQAELVKKGVQALPAQNMEGKVGRCVWGVPFVSNPLIYAEVKEALKQDDHLAFNLVIKQPGHLYVNGL